MRSETEVLRDICDYLHGRGYFFWRSNNIPVFGRALPKYSPRGLPDICIVRGGLFIGLEVKREGSSSEREKNGRKIRPGMLTPDQAEFGARLVMNGAQYRCVRSVDEVVKFLEILELLYGRN